MADGRLHIVDNRSSAQRAGTLPPPLRMLRDRAERHFTNCLKTVFEHVDDTFFDLADRADNYRQQTHYFDAMRLIRFERKTIETDFQQAVGRAFDNLVGEAAAERQPATPKNNTDFELAASDELEEIIALDTMVSRADENNRQKLQYLTKRLESLTSRPVAPKDNPLGPDTVCDAFFRATKELDIGIRSKLVLLKLFERYVVTSLTDFLQQSNQLLQELGVLPELEAHKGAPAEPIRGKRSFANRHPGDFLDRGNLQYQQQNYGRLVSQLNSLLSRECTDSKVKKIDSAPEARPADIVEVLGSLQRKKRESLLKALERQLQSADQPMVLGSTERGLIYLVDALFKRVRADQSFPSILTPELPDVEIAIAKIALNDPGFFDRERHPARRLLNEMAQAAMGLGSDADQTPLYEHICKTLKQLQNSATDQLALTRLLTDFVAYAEKQRRCLTVKEQHLLEDEKASSQLNYSYTLVKSMLERRIIGMELPKVVVAFIEQAWSKVLFLSHLREGEDSSAWLLSKQVLDQVIDLSLLGHEFSLQIATQFLDSIRLKLAEIALDPYQTEHLIRDLEQLLQAGAAGSMENIERVQVEEIYPSIPGEQMDKMDFAEECGVEEGTGKGDDGVEESWLHDIESIPRGAWLEFRKNKNNLRARFIGTVGPANKLIFADQQGIKIAEGNSFQLAAELKSQNIAILDSSPLFDRALAGVVEDMRNRK